MKRIVILLGPGEEWVKEEVIRRSKANGRSESSESKIILRDYLISITTKESADAAA